MRIFKTMAASTLVAAGIALAATAASAQVRLDVGTGASVNVGGSATGSVNAGAAGSAQSSATSSGGTSTGVTATGSMTVNDGEDGVVVTRGDVTSNFDVMSSASVSTSADLDAYAVSFISSDEDVTRVEARPDEVSVWYKQPAKLIGLIPVRVSAEGSVSSDGTVDVDYPWYSFLTTYDDARLESELDATAGSIARAETSTEFSASVQARLISAIHSVMKAHAEASAGADASADVEIE